jgi:nucleoside 2-deoxyribosyltransferase
MLAYLCGPIEFASDGGKMWRRKLTPFLTQQLGHRVYDPAEDERKSLTEEEAANFREWKTTDVDRFRRVLRKIIHFDLDLIENKADYVICHLGDSAAAGVTSGGTPAELTFACRKSIPVYMVTSLKPDQISGWMLGCADQIFDSVDTLKTFLLQRYGSQRQSQLWKD